jgi:uncharacterized protein
MGFDRRDFLKISGAGVASVIVAGNLKAGTTSVEQKAATKIIYRTLGRTGIKLPIISMGAMRADNPNLLKAAVEAGIIHFDSAQSYQEGRNEEMLGDFFQQYKRESFVISTKIGLRQQLNREEFLTKVDLSLKRLKTNYIDILYLHGVRSKEAVLDPATIDVLNELKKSGKIRFAGVSTHSNMADVIHAAVEAKAYDVILTSYNFKLENLPELKVAIDEAAKAGLGIVAMKTMAGVYWDKEKTRKINIKAAIKWALLNENIHTSIPGFTSFEQLNECMSVMEDLTLTEQEKEDLKGDSLTAGLFCQGCEQCLPQCPNNVPVPDIMRSYMYAYGYRDLKLAREVIEGLPANAQNDCNLCPVCKVNCRQGFDIQAKAIDILRIQHVPQDFLA